MDIATLLGVLGAIGAIVGAIFYGGSASAFVNFPGLVIVIGGTLFVNLIKFPLGHTLGAMKVAMNAFRYRSESASTLISEGVNLANIARKEGLLGLESVEIDNPFLKQGIQLAIDGHEPEFVTRVLTNEISLTIERHDIGQRIFKGIGDSAPAMGMIGTLIGLVQMMSNMSDPKQIGPAMAVALLTTLYGAALASVLALPIAEKLEHRSAEERLNRSLVLETINSIQEGLNPRVMEEILKAYLPMNKRDVAPAQDAA